MAAMEVPRWFAEVDYRTDSGINTVPHAFEELEELHDIIESGPHFDTVEKIVIWPQRHADSPTLTVEQSERL